MTPAPEPALILCAHGTRDPHGQEVIEAVAQAARAALGVDVRLAYVDVQEPTIADVVAGIERSGEVPRAVVVPFLLAGGYHVHVDIAEATADRPDVAVSTPMGPDPRLTAILLDRIAQAGVAPGTALVMSPAGSSDARSARDSERVLHDLARQWDGPVRIGYASGIEPTVAQAVAAAREAGAERVAVASYLLAPGVFQRSLSRAGADLVTAPLAPDERIVEIIAERYRDAGGA